MKWQPIETAPKDGTKVDLWMINHLGRGWREPDAYWIKNEQVSQFDSRFGTRDGWYGPNHSYEGEDGWVESPEMTTREGIFCFDRATHWMPLPEPPTN